MQLSKFALSREVISEWSKYEEQSQRVLDAYDHIYKIRTRVALVVIFYLTYQYSFFHFITALGPDAIHTLSVGLFLAPGIAAIWRIMTIRRMWRFLEFSRSRWLHSVGVLLTPTVIVSAVAWCLILFFGKLSAWVSTNPHGLAIIPAILGSIAGIIVLVAILVGLPLSCFFVRFAHPMLESIVTIAITCTIGISQFLYAGGGPIPPHIGRIIALGGIISISTICIAEFLTLYWLGLRLDYIPIPRMVFEFKRRAKQSQYYGPVMGWVPVHVDPRLQYLYRRKSGYSVVITTLAATVIMVWIVVQVMHGAIVSDSFG
jgi:hypothetical protein